MLKSLKIEKKLKRSQSALNPGGKVGRYIVWDIRLMKKLLHTYFQVDEQKEYFDPENPDTGLFNPIINFEDTLPEPDDENENV
jgi:hypothetical protein